MRPGASLQNQCRALFRCALQDRKVEFPHSSSELGSNAFAMLDELIQIIADCPAATISITGHTDSSGNESPNRHLSKERANSVIIYLIEGGIAAGRLRAIGAGSSAPLRDENNARSLMDQ